MAFGQTGSGKTYTISNMIDLTCNKLFEYCNKLSKQYNSSSNNVFEISYKCIEMLGADVYDLQNKPNKVVVCENK